MTRKKVGEVVVPNGAYPEDHELETARFLANLGYVIEFVVPSRVKGQKSADIVMDGELWEVKRPKRLGKYTIEHAFQSAIKQAHNVIFDLRNLASVQQSAIRQVEKWYEHRSRRVKGLLIITHAGNLIEPQTDKKRKQKNN